MADQHWVPRLLLRNFADGDGKVFLMDIETEEIKKRPPKFIACAPDFNEFVIDGGRVSFESELQKIETKAAPVLKSMIASASLSSVSQGQRQAIADFVAAQSFRTEAFYKGLESGLTREQFGAVFAQLWRSAFLVSEEIERRKWLLLKIDHDEVFYLGDSPVVLQHAENPSSRAPLGFDIAGVEVYMPITPTLALYFLCSSISDRLVSGLETAKATHQKARAAIMMGDPNRLWTEALEVSQRSIRNLTPMVNGFDTGAAVVADARVVMNVNYLQAMWAHRAVYSLRNDFSFAKRVYSENPQYKATPKTGFAIHSGAADPSP